MFYFKPVVLCIFLIIFIEDGHTKFVNKFFKEHLGVGKYDRKSQETVLRKESSQNSITISTESEHGSKLPAFNDTELQTNGACGGTIYLGSGIIRSPNYPNKYLPNMNCIWFLYAPEVYTIKLKFLDFLTEASCSNDYLEIRDGVNSDSHLLGKFCGAGLPPNISSSSNSIRMHFHSDVTIEERGFELVYETTSTTSANCDCGPNAYSCSKLAGQVKCNCRPGYEQKDGICQASCNCGPFSLSCTIADNVVQCNCKSGYLQKGENCIEPCDCGINSYNCESNGLVKRCYCKFGYIQKGDICVEECDCGPNSYGCALYWNVVKCACKEGYEQQNYTCEAQCNCGVNSLGCEKLRNVIKCQCKKGYSQQDNQCQVLNGPALPALENDSSLNKKNNPENRNLVAESSS